MLQQTTVQTVRGYFSRFMAAFPAVEHLAAADEADVLRLWEGLGYYRRARMLHAAARQVVDRHAGVLPGDVETLMTLPGVGRYTAGAIVSIAFDRPAPILEANTIRLFARLLAVRDDSTRASVQRRLWQVAEELLPSKQVARFNQALMEVGSLVCTPTNPNCGACPLATWCEAHQQGVIDQVGPTTNRTSYTDRREAAVVVAKDNRWLVRQCVAGERWAGLWDFPRFEVEAPAPLFATSELQQKVATLTGIECRVGGLLTSLKHGVTRYRIVLDCYRAEFVAGRVRDARWVNAAQLEALPLSVTGRKLARLLVRSGTNES
jgi:A/G-specific adenine glycosylase